MFTLHTKYFSMCNLCVVASLFLFISLKKRHAKRLKIYCITCLPVIFTYIHERIQLNIKIKYLITVNFKCNEVILSNKKDALLIR